jgi:plasmid stabilization system protein ParE
MAAPNYRLARRAIADLERISDYLGQRNLSAADRVIDELFRAFDILATNPDLGISLNELRANLRMFRPAKPAASYLVFYYAVPDGVMVSAILHSARDWMGMLLRGEWQEF